jgi:hypothetical protein
MTVIIATIVAAAGVLTFRYFTGLKRTYAKLVDVSLAGIPVQMETVRESELEGLPAPLRRYMDFCGVVGTEHVNHFRAAFTGRFKLDPGGDWAPVKAEQYSFIHEGRRLFAMGMKHKGLPVNALHHYRRENASMTIKIMDLLQVVHHEGELMLKGETVTWFNDLCVWAPAALLRADVSWEEIDANRVKGRLTSNGITVEAILIVDDEGRLVDFISEDRYVANKDGTYDNIPWSTPMYDFRDVNGLRLGCRGAAIWHYPDAEFKYIELEIEDVTINPKNRK